MADDVTVQQVFDSLPEYKKQKIYKALGEMIEILDTLRGDQLVVGKLLFEDCAKTYVRSSNAQPRHARRA